MFTAQAMSKAQTLERVSGLLTKFDVPHLVYFSVLEYEKDQDDTIRKIQTFFSSLSATVAVRSSSLAEDNADSSNAGKFESILNVEVRNRIHLVDAFERVIAALKRVKGHSADDQVIVQSMINNPTMSGVLFTHELSSGAPYYVINYDDVSGRTDTVTSGDGEHANKSLYVLRGKTDLIRSSRITKLLEAVAELELVMDSQYLDIEFAIDEAETPYLFQVRLITAAKKWKRDELDHLKRFLDETHATLEERLQQEATEGAGPTLLGQMPDWNPAEILGQAPTRLSESLYQRLITDDIWSLARAQMGYSRPTNRSLLVDVAGHSFVDVGLSFASFIPEGVSSRIKARLVKHWTRQLQENPQLHDKVEFDVAITCFSFDLESKVATLIGDALTTNEKTDLYEQLAAQMRMLLFSPGQHSVDTALSKIAMLKDLQSSASYFAKDANARALERLIADCQELGTLPFSILARYGFIAKTMLLSLVSQGLIDNATSESLLKSVKTVATDFLDDIAGVKAMKLSEHAFWDIYGHLRPGSYDICSPRYDTLNNFFEVAKPSVRKLKDGSSTAIEAGLSSQREAAIDSFFRKSALPDLTWAQFKAFVHTAIEAREYSKFVFTKSLSGILEIIAEQAARYGFAREDITHLSIADVLALISVEADDGLGIFQEKIQSARNRHALAQSIRLPQLVGDSTGAYIAPFQVSRPNLITNNTVSADAIYLNSDINIDDLDLFDKIVLIESADPGFDWIFAHNIAGLITQFGGANSHMAIRSAEFALPAAIGCGLQLFEELKDASIIRLDCSSGLITKIS